MVYSLQPSLPRTGTGKTLSLICSSLQWLEDSRRRAVEQAQQPAVDAEAAGAAGGAAAGGRESEDDEPDWLRGYSPAKAQAAAAREAQEQRARQLQAVRAGLAAKRAGSGRPQVSNRVGPGGSGVVARRIVCFVQSCCVAGAC